MSSDFRPTLQAYYDRAAGHYASAVEPVMAPLVASLIAFAGLRPGERVIDLGTGSGLAARLAAGVGVKVCALDLSAQMAQAAHRLGAPAVVQGDMHHLPFHSALFDAALAVLAFNSTDPAISMAEARRVLKPGGRLVMQEWGTPDDLSELFGETLDGYAVADPPPALAAQRAAQRQPHPWDALETSTDIVALLDQIGFAAIQVETVAGAVPLTVEAFIAFKLAWPVRRAEVEAMPDEVRALCLSDLQENLTALAGADGRLVWEPNLVRLRALRP